VAIGGADDLPGQRVTIGQVRNLMAAQDPRHCARRQPELGPKPVLSRRCSRRSATTPTPDRPAPTTRTSRCSASEGEALICAPGQGSGLTQLSPACTGHRPSPRKPSAPADAGAAPVAGSAMESDAGTGQRDSRRSGSGSSGSRAGANDRRSTDASAADPPRWPSGHQRRSCPSTGGDPASRPTLPTPGHA
jgi:hypothetical protein